MEQATAMEMRTSAAKPVRYCGATTRSGRSCRKAAGWGTGHPGRAYCRLHGGSTPSHQKAAAEAEAVEFARGAIGSELAQDPLEALLQSVRLASGTVAYWRLRVRGVDDPPQAFVQGYEHATLNLSRIAKAAIDAGVAERQVHLAERAAEQIVLAAEEALATLKLSAAERTQFATVFAEGLARLEQIPVVDNAEHLLPA